MKAVRGSSRRQYVAVFIILLAVSALLTAGMTCNDGYTLTIASTGPGSVTTPGEGTRTYKAGTVVQLVATPDDGDSEFLMWTGDTGQIANRYSASTTITMNGNYSITATFGKKAEPDPVSP